MWDFMLPCKLGNQCREKGEHHLDRYHHQ
jgi:hypothetical protein